MNVIEKREFIATFMDIDWSDVTVLDSEGCTTPLIYLLNYEEDWKLLMEVVERIETLDWEVTITKNRCFIIDMGESERAVSCNSVTTKEATFNAVVELIKNYFN